MTTAKKTAPARPRTPSMTGSEAGTEAVATTVVVTTEGIIEVAEPVEPLSKSKFMSLDVDELKQVADFFTKDVLVSDPEFGPSKRELLASLASSGDGSDAVTWDDYTTLYLPAQPIKESVVEQQPAGVVPTVVEDDGDESNWVLVKMERKNPRYDVRGYTFTTGHPFHSMPPDKAEKIILSTEGFRLALPSEVQEYYN